VSRKLIVTGGRRDRELQLVGKIVVGRDPMCDLSETDTLLSRRHAEFTIAGDSVVVRDLGSRNGIYVNGSRIAEGTLQSGDVVRIGHLQLQFVEDSSPLLAAPELTDDATGLVFPGPRAAAPASGAPSDALDLTAVVPPPTPMAASPRPSRSADDADATSYVPAPGARKAPSASSVRPRAAAAPGARDAEDATKVVPPPGRSGIRPPAPPAGVRTAVQPPPQDDEATSFVPARPRVQAAGASAVGPSTGAERTAVQPPPKDDERTTFLPTRPKTAVLPPPAPSAVAVPKAADTDADEPTAVMFARPRTAIQPPPTAAPAGDAARRARALAQAMDAIATFLGSGSVERATADAIAAMDARLKQATTAAGSTPDLVNALKELAARIGAAANELT